MIDKILIRAIKLYQVVSSGRVECCRFIPTCSDYAIDAIRMHGSFKGSVLSISRILRCRPSGEFGYDPVPRKFGWFR